MDNMENIDEELLGQILIENNFITQEQLDEALEKQKNLPEWKFIGQILVEDSVISQRILDTVLAIQKHRREESEKEEESNGETHTKHSKSDIVVIGELKHEVRVLRKEITALKKEIKEEIMEDVKKYFRTQIRRATKKK